MSDDEHYRTALLRVRAMKVFYLHATLYVAFNLVIFLIDMLSDDGPWFFWSLIGWGIGLILQGVFTFGPDFQAGLPNDPRDRAESARDDDEA